jgi:hypothetical protein
MEKANASSSNVRFTQDSLAFVSQLATALPSVRPTIVDLDCNAGHLLRGLANSSTTLLLRVCHSLAEDAEHSTAQAEPDDMSVRPQPPHLPIVRIRHDLFSLYPLLKTVRFAADLFVLNPREGVVWPREGLKGLADSDLAAVKSVFECADAADPGGTVDATIATLLVALDLCTKAGEGLLVANNATLDRLLFASGAPHAAAAAHIWGHWIIPGNPLVGPDDAKCAEGPQFQTGVIYFARGHTFGVSPKSKVQGLKCEVARTARHGPEIRQAWACADSHASWEAIRRRSRLRGGKITLMAQDSSDCYTLTLAPGVVRYLRFSDFLEADAEAVIAYLRAQSDDLEIKLPHCWIHRASLEFDGRFIAPVPMGDDLFELDLGGIDALLPAETWDNRLRAHHKVGRFCLTRAMPSRLYCRFHEMLRLKEFALHEFVQAWVREAYGNHDVTKSYQKSNGHIIAESGMREFVLDSATWQFVLALTPFVRERLEALARDESERKSAIELELLRRSKFDCFVYVMEDLRNNTYKIGRSKTPTKRERTLQSEVPQIVMRFSIPAEEIDEKYLHDRFENKRLRGEWFALANGDLIWLVEYLKSKGDVSRALVDLQWLGSLQFASNPITQTKQ